MIRSLRSVAGFLVRGRGTPLGAAAVALLLPGCAYLLVGAVGAGAGFIVHQAFIADDTYEMQLQGEADRVFRVAREVLEEEDPASFSDPDEMTVEGSVGKSTVIVDVDVWEGGRARIHVKARKYALADQDTAKRTAQRIARKASVSGR